ncbi:MAG: hypothetical protein JNG84_00270, partial [Archangium sp.]|nr:hypothetical protein [Archangium sp.]
MASQVLLVADDLATVAAVKRVLSAQGYEVVLATSAADAVIAWSHHLPSLLVLQPSVEGERGGVVLEELQAHPDARLLRVLLLGETLPGFGYPVEPLPIETEHFADSVAEAMRGTRESMEAPTPPPPAPPKEDPSGTLEETLFGDLSSSIEASMQRDLEAQAIASVESTLAQREQDTELQRLEDDVRAEAQRRRQARDNAPRPQMHEPAETPPPPSATATEETSFDAVNELTPPPGIPPERAAADLLARADAMRLESRAVAESTQRTSEHDARTHETAVEALTRRAEHAESLVRREREAREAVESELVQLRETTAAAVNDATAKADAETSALEARIAELTDELATLSEDLLGESARREALETDAAA